MELLLLAGKLGVNAAAAQTIISIVTNGAFAIWAITTALTLVTGGAAAIAEFGVEGLIVAIEEKLESIGLARTTIW